MKVKDLINQLQQLPEDQLVILRKDAEGNSHSPLSGIDGACIYIKDNTWSGDVYSLDWSADDAGMSEEEWAKEKAFGVPCVVLSPIN